MSSDTATRYVFFVSAAYCYAIYRPLQEEIYRRNGKVAWYFARDVKPALLEGEQLLKDERAVKRFKPDVMFVGSNWLPYYLPGLKVMLFHGIARDKRGHARNERGDGSGHYRIRGWFDLYCTHAEEDTAQFSALAESQQHFAVCQTGWPKLDPLFQRLQQQPVASNSTVTIPTVFFASTFSPSVTAAPILADTIEALSKTGKWRFIVTLHPLMDAAIVARYQSMQNENLCYLPPEADLYEAMLAADLMLCDTSSIMYEFMLLGKPLVTYKTRNPGSFLYDVQKVEDLVPAFEAVLSGRPEQQLAAAKKNISSHPYTDGQSSARVLDAVDEMLEGKMHTLKVKPWNLLRKYKVRKRLGYWGW